MPRKSSTLSRVLVSFVALRLAGPFSGVESFLARPINQVIQAKSWISTQLAATSSRATETTTKTTTRREFFFGTVAALWTTSFSWIFLDQPAFAATELFTRQTDQFAYEFQPPDNFGAGNKPLRTHLDEINFKSESVGGYQFGVTVDPVRIESLRQFGTPEEVAAKVVLAEVNRDGVFDVTLMEDPLAGPDNAFYQLNYQSKGKRGTKRFISKFYIQKQKLYALTAQCKEDDFSTLKAEMLKAADSFKVL